MRWPHLPVLVGLGTLLATTCRAEDSEPLRPVPDPQLTIDADGFCGALVKSLAISPDGRRLAAAAGKEVRIWDLRDGHLQATLRGFQEQLGFKTGNINTAVFSPNGKYLVVGVSDNTRMGSTRVYALDRPDRLHALVTGHVGCTEQVAFAPSGKLLATTGCDGHVRVVGWDDRSGATTDIGVDVTGLRCVREFKSHLPKHFCFPVDDNWLLLADCADNPILVDVRRRAVVEKFAEWPEAIQDLLRREDAVLSQFPPGDPANQLTAVPCVFPQGAVWFMLGGLERERSGEAFYWVGLWRRGGAGAGPWVRYREHRYSPVAATYDAGSGLAASADKLGEIRVWRAATQEPLWRFEAVGRQIYRVAWSADGEQLLFGDEPYGGERYNFNRYGNTQYAFRLHDRAIVPGPATRDAPVKPEQQVEPSGAARLQVSFPPEQYLLQLALPDKTLDSVAYSAVTGRACPKVYSYGFAARTWPEMADHPFYSGYEDGKLFLMGVEQLNEKKSAIFPQREFVGHMNSVTSLAESPDGKLLASASLDGTIRLWRVAAPRLTGDVDFDYNGMKVEWVYPKSNAERAGLKADDEILRFDGRPFYERLRRMANGQYLPGQQVDVEYRRNGELRTTSIRLRIAQEIVEPVLTLFLSRSGEWVLWTAAGYYDASPGGEHFVGWHVNQGRADPAKFYTVGQFRKQLYRPDVIDAVLRDPQEEIMTTVSQCNGRVAGPDAPPAPSLDLRQRAEFDRLEPPAARILAPQPRITTAARSATVRAEVVVPAGHRELRAAFRVSGRPVPGAVRIESEEVVDGQLRRTVSQEIPLQSGVNAVSFQAATDASESRAPLLAITQTLPPDPGKPKLFVLAVGISQYRDPTFNLRYADRDAEEFVAAWKRQEGRLYSVVQTKLVTNAEATAGGIRDAMDWVTQSATRSDFVVVLFAGHGFYDQANIWHLAAHELDARHLSSTSVSYAEISLWIDQQVQANAVLFVDTCHAGGSHLPASGGLPPAIRLTSPTGADLWRGSGRLVLAACLPHQESVERDAWKHGAFTKAVLQALMSGEADADHDGALTFDELQQYVKKEVWRITEHKQSPSGQTPLSVSMVVLASVP